MGEKARNFGNRLGNTAMIAPRVAGTALNTATDAIDTMVALPKDALTVVKNTSHNIKDVFVDAWTKGKWYQRVGNVILSPVVATGTALEGAIRTAVTPVVNGVVNTWNTAKNTVTNAWRSTFGRIFSKKPISDFSYDKLNTADIISKDTNRFSRLQFGKKKGKWVDSGSSAKATTAAAATAVAAATTASVASNKEIDSLKKDISSMDKKIGDLTKQLEKALENNEKLMKENSELKKSKSDLEKALKDKKDDSKKEVKSEGKKVDEKKIDEKKSDEKKSTGGETKGKSEDKVKSDSEGKSSEKLDEKTEKKGGEKVEDAGRVEILEDGSLGKKVFDAIKKDNPELKIVFDENSCNGKIDGEKKLIIIGTKRPREGSNIIAPFNDELDMKYQKEHVLLHELSHVVLDSHKNEGKGLVDLCKDKTLSLISKNKKYDTPEKRAKEDACEIFALYCRGGKNFDKYMELLSSDEKASERDEKGLSKISKADVATIKASCEKLAGLYENQDTDIKMAA